jgi:MFS family permease
MRIPEFRALWWSYAINRAGDVLGSLALAVVVLAITHSALATAALFLATQFLPGVCGPWLVARIESRAAGRALPLLYGVEACLLLALAAFARHTGAPVIIALAFADAALAFCARALTRATTASTLIPHDLMPEGKAAFNLALAVAMVAGPVAAGVVIALVGPAAALASDAGSFAIAAVLVARAPGLRAQTDAGSARPRRHLRAGLHYIATHARLRALIVGEGLAFVFFYLVVPVTVVYASRSLNAGAAGYAALLGSWGAGIAIGSVAQFGLARRTGHALILASTAAVAFGYLGTALAPTLLFACAASVVGGVGNGTQWASVETAVHELVQEAFRVRVAAVLEAMAAIAPGVGIVAGGALAAAFSPRAAYLAAGLGLVVLVTAGALGRRRVDDAGRMQHPSSPLAAEPVRVLN